MCPRPSPADPFMWISEHEVFRGYTIWIGNADIQAPDGEQFVREIVHHPGAVGVVPLFDDDTVALVRQYRAPFNKEILEIPAGKREVLEEPIATARRELVEEVGLHAEHFDLLAEFYNSPGYSNEHSYTYLATGLSVRALAPDGIEERYLRIEYVTLDDIPGMIRSGALVDAKSIVALLLARERLA